MVEETLCILLGVLPIFTPVHTWPDRTQPAETMTHVQRPVHFNMDKMKLKEHVVVSERQRPLDVAVFVDRFISPAIEFPHLELGC